MCSKRLSPQGLNGHLRFVHGVAPAEASKTVARAPRRDDSSAVVERLEARIEALEEQIEIIINNAVETVQKQNSPAGMRRQVVSLVGELAEVKNQRSRKEWDVLWSASDESKKIMASLDQLEEEIKSEIADLTARLGEHEA